MSMAKTAATLDRTAPWRGRIGARARKAATRFGRNGQGATAVEFALVALPFLMLMFGILELSFIFMMNITLSNMTQYMALQIRVGNTLAPGASVSTTNGSQMDLADFKTAICNQIYLVPNATCVANLQVDVRPLTSFAAGGPASPISGSTFNSSNFCYYSGGSGGIVEMRVYYPWTPYDPLMNVLASIKTWVSSTGTTTGNWVLISSTEVFKVEPVPGLTNTSNTC